MLTFNQFIQERYLTKSGSDLPQNQLDAAYDMLHKSYSKMESGGYSGLPSGSKEEHQAILDDLTNGNNIIKLKLRSGVPQAIAIYKKQHGRKMIAAATNGTTEGKQLLNRILADDHNQQRAWAEVSGAAGHIMKKLGHPTISNKEAQKLTGKEILSYNDENNSYVRLIGGHVHEKELRGHVGSTWID